MNRQMKLRGRVLDGSGDAVADATVIIVHAPEPVPDIAAVSDDNGRFVFNGLSAGRYRIQATGPHGDKGEAEATLPASEVTLIQLRTAFGNGHSGAARSGYHKGTAS